MQPWYVYILLCIDNTFYIGATNQLFKRVKAHNANKGAKYTRGRTPVILVYFERLLNKSQALKREFALKRLNKKEKEKLIMESHLKKIKFLLNLGNSPNEHEAAAAKLMAQKLIEKFNVTPEQLKEIENSDKPAYSEDHLLYEASDSLEWKNILAFIVANKYDCYVIHEENVLSTGEKSFRYFLHGEPEDRAIAHKLFHFLLVKIVSLISMHCRDQNQLYIDSYSEGVVNGARINIEYEDFSVPSIVKVSEEEQPEVKPDAIDTLPKEPAKKPDVEGKKVNTKEKPLNILAYFKGEGHGREIHIGDIISGKELPIDVIDISKLFDF